MAKLLIITQVYENYAWNEDGSIGKGAEAYWKAKGSNEYVIKDFLPCGLHSFEQSAAMAVMALREKIEEANDYMTETIVDYQLVADDYLTDFERDQLEYDGKITYPAKELVWA